MKISQYFNKVSVAIFALSVLFGCEQDNLVKPHALLSESSLTFEAIDAEPQQLKIASDEDWMIDAPEWIWVDPMTGSNSVIVTVSVTDNVDSKGVMAAPREGVITIASTRDGYSIETVIYQKGDTYLGVSEYSVTETAALDDKSKAKIVDGQVVALAAKGFILSDGETNIYVASDADVNVGDILFLNGEKSTANNLPLFIGDEVEVRGSAEVEYPAAENITSTLDSYKSASVSLVSIEGTLVGSALKNIPGDPATEVAVYEPNKKTGLDELNVHKVVLTGYYVGTVDGSVNIVAASVKDNGEDDTIGVAFPFYDDFSWLDPFIAAANAALPEKNQISDCVGEATESADGAANIYSTLQDNGCDVLGELRARGYTDLNPSMKTIYLQDAYFKFGATDKQSGLILPLMKIEGAQDVIVSFRWCCQLSAARNVDDVKMVVEINGPGTVVTKSGSSDAKVSDDIVSTQKKDEMYWMDASVTITGATKSTFITIRPNPMGTADKPVTGVHRYYLDDISVISIADAAPATIELEGVDDDLITFEGTPEGPVSFDVNSDMDYKVSTSAKWLSLDVTEGLAHQMRTVTVTCAPSELNTLRKSSIIIKSGSTTRTIQVVQSAAGQELAPFISLKSGNRATVLGEGEAFTATVQANVDYDVEILDDWIKAVETPGTRALVEFTDRVFTSEPNLTGAVRTGRIRFYNDAYNVETVLTVVQENFIPRITVTTADIYPGVSGKGTSVMYSIDANIPYAVSSDAAWVRLPASKGDAGVYQIPVTFDANTSSDERAAKVKFTNTDYSYELELDVMQYPAGIVFQDDFSWLNPMIEAYNSLNPSTPIGKSVEDQKTDANAPNAYTAEPFKTYFPAALKAAGYVDMNAAGKVVYPQDAYLKLGKTSVHTSLMLPALTLASASDINLEFDWCAHIQGTGKVDPVTLTVVISGDGEFETGGKYSEPLGNTQETGEMFWTHASVKIKGATKNTRLNIVYSDAVDTSTGAYNYTVSGAHRWHIDNIVVK